jgi:hypothetical protein
VTEGQESLASLLVQESNQWITKSISAIDSVVVTVLLIMLGEAPKYMKGSAVR